MDTVNIHDVCWFAATVERINFQKKEIIVNYFLCNPSVTKQCDASNIITNITQIMPHRQDENIQRFALLCHIASAIFVCKQTAASMSKHVREVLAVLAKPPGNGSKLLKWLLNTPL